MRTQPYVKLLAPLGFMGILSGVTSGWAELPKMESLCVTETVIYNNPEKK